MEKYNWDRLKFLNENQDIINQKETERTEQDLIREYILPTDVVLELGARYGTTTCLISKHSDSCISVEPDNTVWNALENNLINNDCNNCLVIKGFVSKKNRSLSGEGYGKSQIEDKESSIPNYSFNELEERLGKKINVLFVDCEGCFEEFLKEFPEALTNINLIFLEKDQKNKCNYDWIDKFLKKEGFEVAIDEFHSAYVKPPRVLKNPERYKKNKVDKVDKVDNIEIIIAIITLIVIAATLIFLIIKK